MEAKGRKRAQKHSRKSGGRWRPAERMFKREAVNRASDKAAQDAKLSMALTTETAGDLWWGQKPA